LTISSKTDSSNFSTAEFTDFCAKYVKWALLSRVMERILIVGPLSHENRHLGTILRDIFDRKSQWNGMFKNERALLGIKSFFLRGLCWLLICGSHELGYNQAKSSQNAHRNDITNISETTKPINSVFSVHFVIGETIITVNVQFIISCFKMAYRHRTFVWLQLNMIPIFPDYHSNFNTPILLSSVLKICKINPSYNRTDYRAGIIWHYISI